VKEGNWDEIRPNSMYRRKHAILLLNGPFPRQAAAERELSQGRSLRAARDLDSEDALGSGRLPKSVRLNMLLPGWMPWIHCCFQLTPELERQLLQTSVRSIDDRLCDEKRRSR
jgi:hypothetical protein